MSNLSWNDKYITGNLIIDDQHKKLFAIYDNLVELNPATIQKELKLNSLIEELVEYASYHFSREKEIAQFLNLTIYEDHENEHHKFTYTIHNFKKRLILNFDMSVKNDLCFYVYNWIGFHILKEDIKLFTLNEL